MSDLRKQILSLSKHASPAEAIIVDAYSNQTTHRYSKPLSEKKRLVEIIYRRFRKALLCGAEQRRLSQQKPNG